MAIVSVYDLDGVEHKRESVDARELVAIGWSLEPKEPTKTTEQVVEPETQPEQIAEQPAKRGRKAKAE